MYIIFCNIYNNFFLNYTHTHTRACTHAQPATSLPVQHGMNTETVDRGVVVVMVTLRSWPTSTASVVIETVDVTETIGGTRKQKKTMKPLFQRWNNRRPLKQLPHCCFIDVTICWGKSRGQLFVTTLVTSSSADCDVITSTPRTSLFLSLIHI